MALVRIVQEMDSALVERRHPALTRWNRLEGRPRTHDFSRALRAEVRDALWMIARQWQLGEFHGDDAGSPVLARVCIESAAIDRFQPGDRPPAALDRELPLEATVERRPLPLRAGTQYLSLDLRLAVGRRWLKLLAREAAAGRLATDYRDDYVARYAVPAPDPEQVTDAAVCAHADVWQQASVAAERSVDGIALLEHLDDPAHHAFDGIGADPGDEASLDALAGRLRDWFGTLILEPADGGDSWLPPRLEYQFACAAAADATRERVMRAEGYYHGHLDWYALDRRPDETQLGDAAPAPAPVTHEAHTFIPASLAFEGMPNPRWWAFEDRRTNFGDVRPDTTDVGKLLLMEFALVYANDWFVLPHTLDVGTVTAIQGIAVTDVFGDRVWIEPVREQPAAEWGRWSMFTLGAAVAEPVPPPATLVLLPAVAKVQEGRAIDEVALVRDEMANMVWGVERQIPLPSGASRPGGEAARELVAFLQRPLDEELQRLQVRLAELEAIPEAARTAAERDEITALRARLALTLPPDPAAPVRYRVANSVPENWIPFIPVFREGSTRLTQLQRAALPRILNGDPNPPEKIRPRTSLLRHGLPRAYFINEEEVPRAGAVVTQCYQRTRSTGGRVVTWYGAQKQSGRGEGSSGLAYDRLTPTQNDRDA